MTSSLSKFLKSAFLFTAVAVVVYTALVTLLTVIKVNKLPIVYRTTSGLVFKGGDTYARFQSFDPEKKYDILIFGSSIANRGISSYVLKQEGLTVYNLGTDNQTLVNTNVLVKNTVKKGKVKLVVVDVFERVLSESPMESTADIIENAASDKIAFGMALAQRDIRTVNMMATRLSTHLLLPVYKESDSLYEGYKTLNGSKHFFEKETYTYIKNEDQMHALKCMLNYLKENNIKIMFVRQPKSPFYRVKNEHLLMADIKNVLTTYGLPFYDYAESNVFSKDDFYDEVHLNKNGAEKYTNLILKDINIHL